MKTNHRRRPKEAYAPGARRSFGFFVFSFSLTIFIPVHLKAAPIVLPAETFAARNILDTLAANLAAKNYSDAAASIDALLGDEADQLIAMRDRDGNKDGGLISVAAWIQTLPRSDEAAIATAYREKFDPAVRARIEALQRASGTRPEQFYSLARRYRFSAAGAAAYALAADRLLQLGDLPGAHALYQLALGGGWTPDAARSGQIELLRRFDEGKTLAIFPSAAPATEPASSIPGARIVKPAVPFSGPLPFDAPWLGGVALAGHPRLFPFASNDKIYVAASRTTLAFKESGQVTWTSGLAEPAPSALVPPVTASSRPAAASTVEGNRHPAYHAPAVLADVYGRAQILIARHHSEQGSERDDEFCLRSYRASDGKLLWTSETQPLLKDLSFASVPAISGLHTYAIALSGTASPDSGDQRVGLMLLDLDTLSGALRWQATLGTFTLPSSQRAAWGTARPWDEVWEQSEPLVAGDAVCITPSAGFAAAIGRFDGKLRWIRPYPRQTVDGARAPRSLEHLHREAAAVREARKHPPAVPVDIDPALGERWRGTPALCGIVLIAAPPDALSVFGLDAATGRLIWSKDDLDVPTLIGQTATTAVFAGTAVTAIEARDGQPAWRWDAPKNRAITGPATMKDGNVLVPTATTIVVLRAEDGWGSRESLGIPVLRRMLNADTARKALQDAGAGKAFGLPAAE